MIIQHFSGVINSIKLDISEFEAFIYDITNPNNLPEIICSNLNNFSYYELEHISNGSLFNWFIIKENETIISKMELIKLSNKEKSKKLKTLKKIKKQAKKLSIKLNP